MNRRLIDALMDRLGDRLNSGGVETTFKYAITHRLGMVKGKGFTMPKLKPKKNPDVEASVQEEIYQNGAYMVYFRGIRKDTGEVVQRWLC